MRDNDYDSENIFDWLNLNKTDLYQIILNEVELDNNGTVYIRTNNFGDCSIAFKIYRVWISESK